MGFSSVTYIWTEIIVLILAGLLLLWLSIKFRKHLFRVRKKKGGFTALFAFMGVSVGVGLLAIAVALWQLASLLQSPAPVGEPLGEEVALPPTTKLHEEWEVLMGDPVITEEETEKKAKEDADKLLKAVEEAIEIKR